MTAKTFYEDLTWGMGVAEVAATLKGRTKVEDTRIVEKRKIKNMPVEVAFHFRGGNGLDFIEVSVLKRYKEWGDGDADESALIGWVTERAGPASEREPATAKWHLPGVNIWTYCDESLGLYFEIPKTS